MRVPVAIPIVLRGTDSSGQAFEETTRTTMVNKHGAKITTSHKLFLGSEVVVENRAMDVTAKATVVWIGDKRTPNDPLEVAVQLHKAENIWGIVFPPEDWEDGAPKGAGGQKLDKSLLPPLPVPAQTPAPTKTPAHVQSGPAPTESAVTPVGNRPTPLAAIPAAEGPKEPPPKPEAPPSQPAVLAVPVAASGVPNEGVIVSSEAALQKLTQQHDEITEARVKAYGERLIRFTNQFGLRVQANLQDAANRTEDRMVGLLEQKLGGLADRVQASQSALENLLARFEQLRQNIQLLVEDTERRIQEASHSALQSAAQDLTTNLRNEVESASATFELASQKRIQDAGSKAVEAILKEADEHLAVLTENRFSESAAELKARQTQGMEEVTKQFKQITLSVAAEFRETLSQMAGEIAPSVRAEAEESLGETAAKLVAEATQSLQQQSQMVLQDTLLSLQQAAQDLQGRIQEETVKVRHSCEQEGAKASEAFTRNIALRTEAAMGSLNLTTDQGTSKLRAAQIDPEKVLTANVGELRRQVEARSAFALESYQTELQNTTRAFQEGAARQFSQKLQGAAEDLVESSAEAMRQGIQDKAAEAVETVTRESTQRLEALADEILSKSAAEAEKASKAGAEDYQKQLAARSAFALESLKNDLQGALRTLQEAALRQFSEKLQETADESLETSAEKAQLRVQSEAAAAAETFSKESSKRLAALAEEMFARSSQELQTRLNVQAKSELDRVIQSGTAEFIENLKKTTRDAGLTLEKESWNELQKVVQELLRGSAESLRKEMNEITAQLHSDLKASKATLAEDARKQLAVMTQSTVDSLNREAFAGLEEYRTRLRKSAQESREASLRELEVSFREALERQRASISAFLQQQAEQSRDHAALQIKTITEQIVAKATDALDRQMGRNTRMLADLGDQARAGLDNQVQKIEMETKNSVWEFQRQIDQSSGASIDKFRREMGTLVDEVVSRLHQSVRTFQSSTSDEIRAELEKASDNLLEVSAAQMRKQTEDTLELITEKLKEKEEEVVNDAADVFRGKIAEIFAILQPGPKKPVDRDLSDAENAKKPLYR